MHSLEWMALALLLAVVFLAAAGALRWDVLKLWWVGLFDGARQGPTAPHEIGRAPPVPKRLHEAELQHQSAPRRPGFHRSGRRSSGGSSSP